MNLRYYQQEALDAIYKHFESSSTNPCIALPTGSGKSLVIAQLCRDITNWGGRVLVVSHVKELLAQLAGHLADFSIEHGIYSAGLDRRDANNQVVIAGVQSVYQKATELGRFDLIICDEVHRVPLEGDGQYRTLFNGLHAINPNIKIVGLTATPYRTDGGYICNEDSFLNEIVYSADVSRLMDEGYLCRVISKGAVEIADMKGCLKSGADFNATDMQRRFTVDGLVIKAVAEMLRYTVESRKVLIFSSGLEHADMIAEELRCHGHDALVVSSKHDGRDESLETFRDDPEAKFLINYGVLTTGFDQPDIDCVVLLRATCSPGLYVQMVGRGMRVHPSKRHCLVLDFGDNVHRHGTLCRLKINEPEETKEAAETKECPDCNLIVPMGTATCPECGFTEPVIEQSVSQRESSNNHNETASNRGPMDEVEVLTQSVHKVSYRVHTKRGADENAPKTLCVTYLDLMFKPICSEYVCFEHEGFARNKALTWWLARTNLAPPEDCQDALDMIEDVGIREAEEITVEYGDKFPRILKTKLGPWAEKVMYGDDDIPF